MRGAQCSPEEQSGDARVTEPAYPDGPLASRKAPSVEGHRLLRLVTERDEVIADIEAATVTLSRLLQTPALPGNEDRRMWSIQITLEELARLDRVLEETP